MNLNLAPNLSLPLKAAVAQKYAWIGRSSSGKSYCAGKVTELLLDAGAQVVIVDPVGIWWGLRLAANGKDPGIQIPILGGAHKDIPLEPSSGKLVADLIVDKSASMVLDVSEFSGGETQRFVADFATHLFQRKKNNKSPMLLIWEEAQEFIPQQVFRDSAKMVGACERIAKIGRNFGIGTGLISQRPQEVNKKILNQTEVLFVYQTTGPQERKAIEGWVVEHDLDLEKVVESLPSLPQGTGYVWSPQWLKVFQKVRCNPKRTFDASSTPEFDSSKRQKQVELAPIDLEKLEVAMQETIEKAKAEDPRELRKRIAELQTALKKAEVVKPEIEVKEVPVFTDKEVRALEAVSSAFKSLAEKLTPMLAKIPVINSRKSIPLNSILPVVPPQERRAVRAAALPSSSGKKFPGGERKILTVLAQYPQGKTKVQIAVIAGYAHSGGSYNNYLSALRSKGLIEGGKDLLRITEAGVEALGAYEPLPTGQELLHYWLGELGKAEREILRVLAGAYPNALTKEDLAREAGYEVSGGGFNNALSRLRTLDLISGRGELRAAEELF